MKKSLFDAIISITLAIMLFPMSLGVIAGCSSKGNEAQASVSTDEVLFFSGGTIDDQVASTLLFTMDDVKNLGTVVGNTDCIGSYAMQSQWKMQSYFSKTSDPIVLSEARAWNPFPYIYRKDSLLVYNSEYIKQYVDNPAWPPFPSGNEFIENILAQAVETNRPITLLITEPMTLLTEVLKKRPELESGIKRMIWMGGAIDVAGNLDPTTIPPEIANDKAGWNAFWDPYAVDWIFNNTSFPLIVFPLDVTNQAKLTDEFMASLQAQSGQYRYSDMVYSLYSLVSGEPYFEMWNTLTTTYVARPDLFEEPVSMNLTIETEGYWQGTVSQSQNGRAASVVLNIADKDGFYDYVLKQLKRN